MWIKRLVTRENCYNLQGVPIHISFTILKNIFFYDLCQFVEDFSILRIYDMKLPRYDEGSKMSKSLDRLCMKNLLFFMRIPKVIQQNYFQNG